MKKLIIIISLLCITVLNAQDDNVATIGDIKISAKEFLERYELSPVLGKENIRNEIGAKYSLLYSIIAEKIWAMEAEKHKIDTSKSVYAPMDIIEKLYVKDALYKKEILDKIEITQEEINKAVNKYVRKLKLKYIFSSDEKDIKNKFYLLKNGYAFDSLYKALVKEDNTKEVEFGLLEENVEDEVYKLPVGGFTEPIFWNNGFYIFYLESETRQLFIDTKGKNNTVDLIKNKLVERKADVLRKRYTAQLFKNVKAKSEKKIIDLVANNVFELLKNKEANKDSNGTYFNLTEKDGLWLEIKLKDYLNTDFVKINNKNIKLEKFIDELTFFGLRFENKDLRTITIRLNRQVKQFIEDELIAAEGIRQGLNHDPEVIRQVRMWKDNYLFQVYRSKVNYENFVKIKDSLSVTKEATDFSDKTYSFIEINFADLNQAEDIFANLSDKDYNQLINCYKSYNSINISLKTENEKDVEPALKEALSTLKQNDIYGPINSKSGYKIIKIIDVKVDTVKNVFNNSKEIEEYARNIAGDDIAKTTAIWAKKYGLNINDELLKSLKVTRINSYIIKMFGFGGRIGAVPIMPPFYKWVEEYKKLKENSL